METRPTLDGFRAEDGGVSLNKNTFRPPYGGNLMTADNDNSILYLSYYLYLNFEHAKDERESFFRAVKLTKHSTHPGLYHRNPGRTDYINSHDNYLGLACGCILFNDIETFKAIVAYGKKNWYILNDENPGKHLKLRRDHPSGLHQPHAWFMYILAAGLRPGWLTTLWNVGNLIHTGYILKHYSHHDSHYLAWIRIEGISLILGDKDQKLITGLKKVLTKAAIKAYIKQMKRKSGGQAVYFNNFVAGHPVRILASKLSF